MAAPRPVPTIAFCLKVRSYNLKRSLCRTYQPAAMLGLRSMPAPTGSARGRLDARGLGSPGQDERYIYATTEPALTCTLSRGGYSLGGRQACL